MPGQPANSVIPLPGQWNKSVRSAVLHAISPTPAWDRRGQRLSRFNMTGPIDLLFERDSAISNSVEEYTPAEG